MSLRFEPDHLEDTSQQGTTQNTSHKYVNTTQGDCTPALNLTFLNFLLSISRTAIKSLFSLPQDRLLTFCLTKDIIQAKTMGFKELVYGIVSAGFFATETVGSSIVSLYYTFPSSLPRLIRPSAMLSLSGTLATRGRASTTCLRRSSQISLRSWSLSK